jgi:hypothetical protein
MSRCSAGGSPIREGVTNEKPKRGESS